MWKSLIVFFSLIVACSATFDPLGEAYNGSYPLTPPFVKGNEITYRWAMIADYGQRYGDKYRSEMKFGTLTINTKTLTINFDFEKNKRTVQTIFAANGFGAQFADLSVFNGRLYTCDRSSGIVYEVVNPGLLVPWLILANGNGRRHHTGFPCRWMTVKGTKMFIGSDGLTRKVRGREINDNRQWVKQVSVGGIVDQTHWSRFYRQLMQAVQPPLTRQQRLKHEAVVYDRYTQQWTFLPHVVPLTPKTKHNILLRADNYFSLIKYIPLKLTRFDRIFTSVKIIPGLKNLPKGVTGVAVGIRVQQDQKDPQTTIVAFALPTGIILRNDTWIDSNAFTGFEFV
ncbi:calcium activated nucleotidase 1b-like protein [Sarcoptes scabiei]|uniref:Calcium activated nucleotidase 1b-like protein n=1 Tax=Sarcoptes scabiei TaxID=52283 RepID=A0A132AGF3_SARSC|nr:calcium activated nucleotidase 1b-like protein [Sarcoptes scabiei]